MTPPTMTSRQALLAVVLAGTLALSVGACGRRGRPEPPPNPNAPAAQASTTSGKAQPAARTRPGAGAPAADEDGDESDPGSLSISPQPTAPGRKKIKPFVVPQEPFILDWLL